MSKATTRPVPIAKRPAPLTTRPAPLTTGRLAAAARALARRDRDLAGILARHGAPPLWARRPGFETLAGIILEQQISLASAAATHRRLVAGLGALTPATCAAAGEARIRDLGVTRQKAAYLVGLARAVEDGVLDLRSLGRLPDDEARTALVRIKGIGPWSANIYLLMALRRPDVWPAGDLALATAARAVKRLRRAPTPEALDRLAEPWRPYRAVAARMLWQHYLGAPR
jgi:DNA-3-methyladenine glycosylase II